MHRNFGLDFIPCDALSINQLLSRSTKMIRSKFLTPGLALALSCAAFAQTGTTFCAATANSSGVPALLTGNFGTGVGSDLHLEVSGGVPNEFGYFLAGNEITSGVMISGGMNCLIGTPTAQMFRYNVAGTEAISVGRFNSAGVFQNLVGTSQTGAGFDVPCMIPSGIPFPILSGDTWQFQLWYRDTGVMAGHSNFSSGLSVTFDYYVPQSVPPMVLIPSGTFAIGSNAAAGSPYQGSVSTQPVHAVTISQDFWMGEHEVTQAEYEGLMGVNPSSFICPHLPVEKVSWNDARLYCAALTAQEAALGNLAPGMEYRLPTEAEWEYAGRATTTTEYSFGPVIQCSDAPFGYNQHTAINCQSLSTQVVGSYAPNAWGLFDMHGNVAEWCLDSYTNYSAGAATDPFFTGGSLRIVRGGGYANASYVCRSAYRSYHTATTKNSYTGFRIVLGEVLVP